MPKHMIRRMGLGAALLALSVGGAGAGPAPRGGQAAAKVAAKVAPPQAQPAGPADRASFTAAEAATARPEGLTGVRIAGDDVAAFRALIDGAARAGDPWLVISGGGENGAFAAGLLAGWTKGGDRPDFGVVTGVSTGALIAPFAFIGPRGDEALRANYTAISAADVFEFGATPASLTDTWPLKDRIEAAVTPALLRAVAAEHARGRRLLVATTQVDSERPVLWDMGAIATRAGQETGKTGPALTLFREIVLASTAVPGVFPPVMIPATAQDGRALQEMHDDGGATAPYYLAPAAALLGDAPLRLPAHTVYLVVNNRLSPEFQMASRTTLSVLGRTMSAAIKAQTQGALALTRAYAARTGLDLRVALIDGRFTRTSDRPFDQGYMQALFAHGEALGASGFGERDLGGPATGSLANGQTQAASAR